jgi:DNA-binding MarR family transcriptional regulator
MTPSGEGIDAGPRCREISAAGYRQLAEFRYRIRQFLHTSEEAARSRGIEPHQHQVLLAIKGLPEGSRPTVRTLSERLCLRHHSTVELIDRLAEQGAVARRHSEKDRREVLIELTPHGEELLHELSVLLWQELRVSGPALSASLLTVLAQSAGRGRSQHGSADANQTA